MTPKQKGKAQPKAKYKLPDWGTCWNVHQAYQIAQRQVNEIRLKNHLRD
jgi:hypothetical protein